MNRSESLCVALDVADLAEARRFATLLAPYAGWAKVGLELFVAHGAAAIGAVRDAGMRCFLDLKLHDIPATMAGGARSAARHGADLLTVHALAGGAGVRAAREAAPDLLLAAVTILTSHDAACVAAIGIGGAPEEAARRLAMLAIDAGAQCLVCSPREVASLCVLGAKCVTPGIRPDGSAIDDQARIATPAAAIRAGAWLLVIGRPILRASDPAAAAAAIAAEIEEAVAQRDRIDL